VLVRDALAEGLDAILAESIDFAKARERSSFGAVGGTSGGERIVLVGMGKLGRRVLDALRHAGIAPVALADNAPRLHGTTIDGHEVLSVAEAAARHREDAIFVVTIWGAGSTHRFAQTREQLRSLGVSRVSPFSQLMWKYPEGNLPHYCQDLPHHVLEQRDAVRAGLELWDDDASRREYLSQVRFRLLADFDGLAHPVAHPQYFPDDLFTYGPAECFVDCGAYDGDTLRVLFERHGPAVHRVIALEPDPVNVATLERYAATARCPGGIVVLPMAAGAARGRVYIETTGTASSALTTSGAAGAVAIDCAPLDELLANETPTFIKMDIEGAEPQALAGARETIRRHRPVLAVCVYHEQNHLWSIPLALAEHCDGYRFHLRPHNEEGWDLICYAVPEERSLVDARGDHG
jgi:FkbM family methyltransferase